MTKIILAGNNAQLATAVSLIIGIRQLIVDQQIGNWIGYPEREYVLPRPLESKLVIQLYSVKLPPFRKRLDEKFQSATVSVPNVDRAKLDWKRIKDAVGGTKGYNYGRSICTVEYENGRQTQVYAATQKTAENVALRLSQLSSLSVRKVTVSTLQKTGVYAEGQPMNRDTINIYPGSFYVMRRKAVLLEEVTAINTKSGRFKERRETIPLFTEKQPENYNQLLNNLWTSS